MKKTLRIRTNYDDWMEVYVDDELVFEGHNVSLTNPYEGGKIFEALGVEVEIEEVEF